MTDFLFFNYSKKKFYTGAWKQSHPTLLEAMVAILPRREVPLEVHEELGKIPWMCLEAQKAKQ
jgi:hypothetical protein